MTRQGDLKEASVGFGYCALAARPQKPRYTSSIWVAARLWASQEGLANHVTGLQAAFMAAYTVLYVLFGNKISGNLSKLAFIGFRTFLAAAAASAHVAATLVETIVPLPLLSN